MTSPITSASASAGPTCPMPSNSWTRTSPSAHDATPAVPPAARGRHPGWRPASGSASRTGRTRFGAASCYVIDLKVLSDVICRQIIQDVDHRNLNTDVPCLKGCIPTAENLALTFWERLRSELPEGLLRAVRVWETDKNWAEVGAHA